eukprot:TRINITY_DN2453_c0_g1_i1.p1 TRINITY_DN2453_c0_g1~~TRINITY_DN2453_c0_g1_i1.p1  ORF type:complete len:318 (-),score=92.99 TRINITY_DN2453_c0_g1_i1:86-1039(-)
MGGLFSISRKDGGGFEKELEKIDSEITLIEIRRMKSPITQKKILGSIFYYALIIELLFIIWYYFHQKPTSLQLQVLHFLPLILIPVLFYLLRWSLQKYYKQRAAKDNMKLNQLKTLLKLRLEERKKATAFDSTQNLLKKYGKVLDESENSPKKEAPNVVPANNNLVHRNVPNTPQPHPAANNKDKEKETPQNSASKQYPPTPHNTPYKDTNITPQAYQKFAPPNSPPKGMVERFVDYLLSTGPKYGFALICGICKHHNGFAPPGEEDMQFKCRVCGALNQRGQDPIPVNETPMKNAENNTPVKRRVQQTPSTPFTPS